MTEERNPSEICQAALQPLYHFVFFGIIGLIYLASISDPALAQMELVKLTASDAAEGDRFSGGAGCGGRAVSISGRTTIIGTKFDDDGGLNSGAAYIFQDTSGAGNWSTYTETKLTASDASEWAFFGFSVAMDGRTALVGAWSNYPNSSAYVFQDTSLAGDWGSFTETKLTPSDPEIGAGFGASVSISGRVALIGAPGPNGGAYIFLDTSPEGDWSSFTETKLTPRDGGVIFGASVSVSGNTAIISDIGDDEKGDHTGAAYIFQNMSTAGDWSSFTETKLTASDAVGISQFGCSVSIHGDTAVVGSLAVAGGGSAYIFHDTSPDGDWTSFAERKLTASDGSFQDFFGFSVSIHGDLILIGSKRDDAVGILSGSAYVYQDMSTAGDWSSDIYESKLTASDGDRFDYFGESVSISGGLALVGAPWDDDWAINSGSAYVFDFRRAERMPGLFQALNEFDLPKGLKTGLRAKAERAWVVLNDDNEANDVVAIQVLEAFVHSVEGQRGKTLTDSDADALEAIVRHIIALLGGA